MCDLVHLPSIHPNLYLGSKDAAQRSECTANMRVLCVANGDTCDMCTGDTCAGTFHTPDAMVSREAFDAFSRPASLALRDSLAMGPTLVHCYAGINRSACTIVRYAIEEVGMAPEDAIQYVRKMNNQYRRIPALTNPSFTTHLMHLSQPQSSSAVPWAAWVLLALLGAVVLFRILFRI